MKLLLSLILIISIALCNVHAYKMNNQKPINHEKINKFGDQSCFNSGNANKLQSFNGGYVLAAYNMNVNTQQGIVQESFFEQGSIDVDYENNQLYSSFQIDYNNFVSSGEIWAFGNNNTEYVVSTVNDEVVCYSGPLKVEIPQQYTIQFIGDMNLGTFANEIFLVQTPSNLTKDAYMVSKVDCSVTSIYTQNSGPVSGSSVQNIFNYVPSSNPTSFNVPSECFTNPNPSSKASAHNLRKSIRLPSILNH